MKRHTMLHRPVLLRTCQPHRSNQKALSHLAPNQSRCPGYRHSTNQWSFHFSVTLGAFFVALVLLLLTPFSAFAQTIYQTDIPGPVGSGAFGTQVVVLPNGNIVVADPSYDSPTASDVGAVYLYHGETLEMISMLTGSKANDRVGGFNNFSTGHIEGTVTNLMNGNFVVRSLHWNGSRGAATWVDGDIGLSGVVSAQNSLVGDQGTLNCDEVPCAASPLGGHPGDMVGLLVAVLPNGNYIVHGNTWHENSGHATFGLGISGVKGVVSSANSLVGPSDRAYHGVGGTITLLDSSNFVVSSTGWNHNRGAATFGSAETGMPTGLITAANSLVGSQANDAVGTHVIPLTNGNYVVVSSQWSNGSTATVGAVTWGDGESGVVGLVSASNSLVGTREGDSIGNDGGFGNEETAPFAIPGVIPLTNGNYVVIGTTVDTSVRNDVGAVTWGNGEGGTVGPVSPANSIMGSKDMDFVGSGGVVPLANGNYVVVSPLWDNDATVDAGAVTWGNGVTGKSGIISPANSLVGGPGDSRIGHTGNGAGISSSGVTPLPNGNYVVLSPGYGSGDGAITCVDGDTGLVGLITPSNSRVGGSGLALYYPAAAQANHGRGAIVLMNGNYVVASPMYLYNDGSNTYYGSVVWGDADCGETGVVTPANSLMGSHSIDYVGSIDPESRDQGVLPLSNGNYVVMSPFWNNGETNDVGAVTWGNGMVGTTGIVSITNSLVGSNANEKLGFSGAIALPNGNFVVTSPLWSNEGAGKVNVGAVTWGSGTSPTVGEVSAANSTIGNSFEDLIGSGGVTALENGGYVIHSPLWDNGAQIDAGAATWRDGNASSSGIVSTANGIVGTSIYDEIGSTRTVRREIVPGGTIEAVVQASTPLDNGDFLVYSFKWDNGSTTDSGSVTWSNGSIGTFGPISSAHSVRGATADQGATLNFQSANNDQRVIVGRDLDQIVTVMDKVAPPNQIVVQRMGSGAGIVTSSPAGINCGSVCLANFANGAQVTLSATPGADSIFIGWSGPCSGTGTCTVTVNQLRLVSASFAANGFTLSVSRSGSGLGKVTSNPIGIDCGSDCSERFDMDAVVTLNAQANQGSVFTGWSGACSGNSAQCQITMNSALNAVATFAPEGGATLYLLTVTKSGNGAGSVTSSPSGITCGSTCSAEYVEGAQVSLSALPDNGSVFTGWSGACSGTSVCNVTMNQARSVSAGFAQSTPGQSQLLVTLAGNGSGVVTSSPAGISCGSDCTENFAQNVTVTLTSAAADGSTFVGWSGACSGMGVCSVVMSVVRSVSATFIENDSGDFFYQFLPNVRR